jgi:hypothetical protein
MVLSVWHRLQKEHLTRQEHRRVVSERDSSQSDSALSLSLPFRDALMPNVGPDARDGVMFSTDAVIAAWNSLYEKLHPVLALYLKGLEGSNFGVQGNKQFVRALNLSLHRLQAGLTCPHCTCFAKGLAYRFSGTSKLPVFKYVHLDSSTHGGTLALNKLILVPRPADLPEQHNRRR